MVHDLAISQWTEFVGPRYLVAFQADTEKPIYLRDQPGRYAIEMVTEHLLDMRLHVIDAKADALRALAAKGAEPKGDVATKLMFAIDNADWAYHPAPIAQPPSMPR